MFQSAAVGLFGRHDDKRPATRRPTAGGGIEAGQKMEVIMTKQNDGTPEGVGTRKAIRACARLADRAMETESDDDRSIFLDLLSGRLDDLVATEGDRVEDDGETGQWRPCSDYELDDDLVLRRRDEGGKAENLCRALDALEHMIRSRAHGANPPDDDLQKKLGWLDRNAERLLACLDDLQHMVWLSAESAAYELDGEQTRRDTEAEAGWESRR